MGNVPINTFGRLDYDFYTNLDGNPVLGGVPNGRNPNGITISIWDNQKQFIGKWHYRNVWRIQQQSNNINWRGYVRPCGTNPPSPNWNPGPGPGQNCNPNPSFTTDPRDFPDMVRIRMSDVTLIEGSPFLTHLTANGERPFRYGGNREENVRGAREWERMRDHLFRFLCLLPSGRSTFAGQGKMKNKKKKTLTKNVA